MKVSDFQKCLRALGELISAKTSAKELTDAADALAPFADYKMEKFAEFLKLAEAKYRETGELPDSKPPKPVGVPRAKKEPAAKVAIPTVEELVAAVEALKVRLRTDQSLTKDGVSTELSRFEKMKQADLNSGVHCLGMRSKPKNKGDAIAMIVNHTISAQGGVERSDA